MIEKTAEQRKQAVQARQLDWQRQGASAGGASNAWANTTLIDAQAAPAAINPERRFVQLQEHRTNDGALLELDPETGFLYKQSQREDYPLLVGKLTATGRVLSSGNADVYRVFTALRKLSGDEKRLMQVRRV